MRRFGKLAFIIGVIIAVITGLVTVPYTGYTLLFLGLVIGLLNIEVHEVTEFLVAFIALMAIMATPVGTAAVVGVPVASVLGNIATLATPAALVVAVKALYQLCEN